MPVACLLTLGLLCLPSGDGAFSATSPGFSSVRTYATPTYQITYERSDVHRLRDLSQFAALCGSRDCTRVKFDMQNCAVRFEFAMPSDPMVNWTGETYTVTSQTSAGLMEGLTSAQVPARAGRQDALRSLKDVVGRRTIRCSP